MPRRGATYCVGIVGCGRKASTIDDENRWLTNYDRTPCSHMSAYRALPLTQVVAAADPDSGACERFRQRWGIDRLYDDYRAMLAQESLDLLSVCTHTDLHARITIDACAAGVRGVLCEKAVATSMAEVDAMREAGSRSGTQILVNHPRRYHPTYQKARQSLESGAIGGLRAITSAVYTKLVHNGSHVFDALCDFAGLARWVSGRVTDEPEDPGGRVIIGFDNGVVAWADVAGLQGFEIVLFGSEGRIQIQPYQEGFQIWRYEEAAPKKDQGQWFQFGPAKRARITLVENSGDETPPMQAAILDLIRAVENGSPPISSVVEGGRALEIALAAHASHGGGGSAVALPLADRELRVVSR